MNFTVLLQHLLMSKVVSNHHQRPALLLQVFNFKPVALSVKTCSYSVMNVSTSPVDCCRHLGQLGVLFAASCLNLQQHVSAQCYTNA
eukprot:14972-Heterococcus_DN1.PRE.3